MTCSHLERCGGCPRMHLPEEAQLEWKRGVLATALGRHRPLAVLDVPPVVRAEPMLGYRTRLKWMVDQGRLGLYERGGRHRVLDVPGCVVASPRLASVAASIRARLAMAPLEAIDLREVATAGGPRVLVTLVLRDERGKPQARLLAEALAAAHPELVGIAVNVRGSDNPQVLGPETQVLVGEATAEDRLEHAYVFATYGSFVQAHRGQARAIASAIGERILGLGARPRVLELFGGSGALGLEFAARGAEVDLVEFFAPAAELASLAAKAQGLMLRATVDDAERFARRAVSEGVRYDAIVVDPPRRGLTPPLRRAIAMLEPRLLAYVSCQPATLARDLEHLAFLGLRGASVCGFDMIPQTDEVESLVFLAPGLPAAIEFLARNDEWTIVDKPAHLPASELARRVAATLPWSQASAADPMTLASGAALVWRDSRRPSSAEVATEWLVLAKGLTTVSGTPHGLEYRRLALVGGHSLLLARSTAPAEALLRALAKTEHPPVGDRHCDAATNRHFLEKHGLDRPFVHALSVRVGNEPPARAPLAGDLAAVLASLGHAWSEEVLEPPLR